MKASIKFVLGAVFFLVLNACSTPTANDEKGDTKYVCPMHCEGAKTYSQKQSCPICKMDLVDEETLEAPIADPNGEIDERSIFNLTSHWKTQDNQPFSWKDLQGSPFILTMVYTTCQAACPRLLADMKFIAEDVNSPNIKYVLVSIDPITDTPKKLKNYAKKNQLNEQWVLLNGSEEDVRELSNIVAVKYMRISPLDFSHSNIISLFDARGVMQYQQEGLGVDNEKIVRAAKSIVDN